MTLLSLASTQCLSGKDYVVPSGVILRENWWLVHSSVAKKSSVVVNLPNVEVSNSLFHYQVSKYYILFVTGSSCS